MATAAARRRKDDGAAAAAVLGEEDDAAKLGREGGAESEWRTGAAMDGMGWDRIGSEGEGR